MLKHDIFNLVAIGTLNRTLLAHVQLLNPAALVFQKMAATRITVASYTMQLCKSLERSIFLLVVVGRY